MTLQPLDILIGVEKVNENAALEIARAIKPEMISVESIALQIEDFAWQLSGVRSMSKEQLTESRLAQGFIFGAWLETAPEQIGGVLKEILSQQYGRENMIIVLLDYLLVGGEKAEYSLTQAIGRGQFSTQIKELFQDAVQYGQIVHRLLAATPAEAAKQLETYWYAAPSDRRKDIDKIIFTVARQDRQQLDGILRATPAYLLREFFFDPASLWFTKHCIKEVIPAEKLLPILGITETADPATVGAAIKELGLNASLNFENISTYQAYCNAIRPLILSWASKDPLATLMIIRDSGLNPYFITQEPELARQVFGQDLAITTDIMLNNLGYMVSFASNLEDLWKVSPELAKQVLKIAEERAKTNKEVERALIIVYGTPFVSAATPERGAQNRKLILWSVEVVGEARVTDGLFACIQLAPKEYVASIIGAFQMVIGLVALPASLIAGFLWDSFNPLTPFYFSLGLTIVAAIMLIFVKEK